MIFQNFGFNRQIIKAAGAPAPNYVSGASVIYDFGYSTSYPGSGTTVYDVSGNGTNGTLVNSPTFSSGNGGYLSFNGTNQRVSYTGYYNSAFTVQMFWKQPAGDYPASGGKQYPGLAGQVNNNGIILGIDTGWPNSSGIYGQWWYGADGATGGGVYIDVSAGIDIRNNWVLYTLSSNGTNSYKYYVNGTNVATNTTTRDRTGYTPTNQAIDLAYSQWSSQYQLGAMMSYLVYPFQLSDSEVTQNYNIFSAR